MTVDDKHACLQSRAAINLIPPVSAISGLDQLSTQPLDMLKYVYDTPRAETLTPHQPFHSLLAQNEQPAFAWHQGCARELPRFITGYPNSIADEAPPHLYLNQSITTGWHHPIGGHAPYSTDSTEVTSLVLCYSLCRWVVAGHWCVEGIAPPTVSLFPAENVGGNFDWHRFVGVSNHQPHVCLLNRLYRRISKNTSKLRVTGLCAGNCSHKWPITRKMFPFDDVMMARYEGLWKTWYAVCLSGNGIVRHLLFHDKYWLSLRKIIYDPYVQDS